MKILTTIVLSIGIVATASVYTSVRNLEKENSEVVLNATNNFGVPVLFANNYRSKISNTSINKPDLNFANNLSFTPKIEISEIDFKSGENLLMLYVNQNNTNKSISDSDFAIGENNLLDLVNGKFISPEITLNDFNVGENLLMELTVE